MPWVTPDTVTSSSLIVERKTPSPRRGKHNLEKAASSAVINKSRVKNSLEVHSIDKPIRTIKGIDVVVKAWIQQNNHGELFELFASSSHYQPYFLWKEQLGMMLNLTRRVSLIMGVAVFTVLSGVVATPHVVQAKPASASTEKPAQPSGTAQESESGTLMKELNLTEQQKKDIKQIRANRTKAINKVLTPDQQAKFKQARASGKTSSQAIAEMNLKPDQKKQIMEIMQKSANEIKSKLTKTQLTTLSDYMRKHSSRTATVE